MKIFLIIILFSTISYSQSFDIPQRNQNAIHGNLWANSAMNLSRVDRENNILNQVLVLGNVPEFLKSTVRIKLEKQIDNKQYSVEYFTMSDYFAIGNDTDYFLIPMTPILAQKIGDAIKANLPTRLMVNEIYQSAKLKLPPQPIPPSAAMITMPVFKQHNDSVLKIRNLNLQSHPIGVLIGGTKKDIVISNNIYQNLKSNVPKPVVIYGWHQLNGVPIQPLYNGHEETYADYSHGVRFISDTVLINGEKLLFKNILRDSILQKLFSDEGKIDKPFYSVTTNSFLEGKNIYEKNFELLQNYPNPFNSTTTILFKNKKEEILNLTLHDYLGKEIEKIFTDKYFTKGMHQVEINLKSYSTGPYVYSLRSQKTSLNKILFLIK
ncbi:MAG: T9SS type A sorting domain-containing protein [Bacteroidetes bacterium]|nr:T9SS type A sorting domain-containing protein [Bacteroidota bacterium]